MKRKWITLGILLMSTVALTACKEHKKKEATTSSSLVAESSTTSESSKKKESNDQAFQSVIDRYNQYISLAKSKNFSDFSTLLNQQSSEELVPAQTTFDYGYKTIQYAFYDIDKDGQNELLIGTPEFVSAIYYLDKDQPNIIKGAGTTSTGGLRSSLSIYDSGIISFNYFTSTSPEGEITTYQLEKGVLKELKKIEINRMAENFEEDMKQQLDLTGKANLEPSTFTWQAFLSQSQAASKVMDLTAIQNGDTSSVAGTWQNSEGKTISFDDTDIVSPNGGATLSPYNREISNGVLKMGVVANPVGGYMIAFIPKDVVYHIDNYQDASDTTRERIWAGQQIIGIENPKDFYYRVD